jgi:Cu/Ag efflux protein CusF
MRTLLVLAGIFATLVFAQETSKNPHELHGKVIEVNTGTKSLKVDHEAVPGWMAAMTMSYAVDKEAVLKEVKPGDQITATVYDGDFSLHNVRVVKLKTTKK